MTNDKSELAARLERAEAIIQTLGGKNGAEKGPLAELKYIVREIRTALPESDIGYKTLLDSVNDLAWIASADGAMLYMNPATAHIYGRPAEDFFNNSERLIEAVHPEDRAEAAKNREKLFALGEVEQTYRIIRPDGEIRWLHDNKKILSDSAGKPLYIRGIATDITEQKELETAQRESEITAKLLIDNPMAAVLLLNSEGVILDINETMEYRFNLSRNQLIGKQMLELLPPKVATRYQEYIGRVIRTGGLLRMEDEWDGRWFDHVIQPIFDSHGKVAKIAFIVRNITAHKLTEKALSKERDKAQIYLNLAGVMFMALDADGCVNMVNRKTCEILEYRQEEIIGWNWFDNFLQEEDKLEVKAIFSRLMCGEIEAAEYYESPVRTRSGKETLIAWHNRVIRNRKEEITGALCSGEDITARKRAEKALKHRLQMEKTIAEVSTLFINITRGRFNYDIDQALRLLGEFSGMDRCYLFQVLEQGELISDIHEWCAPEIEPRIEFLQQLPFSAFPWIKERLQRFETVHIPCVTGLPPLAGAEKANFQKQGIQSLVIVPIRDADTLTGFLGFDSVSAKKNW
ncbi:MAG: PAS domain S-box protein, partial [Gammaproteobacteria bacterium]|nr:PAS domain S-box protein [Gammaproteobacteria bacterium]